MSVDGGGLEVPGPGTTPDEQAVAFAAELIDRTGKAPAIEAALTPIFATGGRPLAD